MLNIWLGGGCGVRGPSFQLQFFNVYLKLKIIKRTGKFVLTNNINK